MVDGSYGKGEYSDLHDFMSCIGGFRVDDVFDRKIQVRAYEDDNGYIMMYDQKKAIEFAKINNLMVGTVSTFDKGYEREGDSCSRSILLCRYQTSQYVTNIKKYFFYSKKINALYEEIN